MTYLDRRQLRISPLAERENQFQIERIAVSPEQPPPPLPARESAQVAQLAGHIRAARAGGRPVMLTYGAHLIKNGLAPIVIRLLEEGWVTHAATNGAGSIHDWEFAYLGCSSEDVRANVARGQFGTWEETGRFINLAVAVGGTHESRLRLVGGKNDRRGRAAAAGARSAARGDRAGSRRPRWSQNAWARWPIYSH